MPKKDRPPVQVSAPAFLGREGEYVADVMMSGWLTQGPYVERLEAAVAEFTHARYAVACSSGTSALHLALLGQGIGPDDHVIVPALSYIATANAVTYCGAKLIFADVDRKTWCLDPADVRRKIARARMEKTRVRGIIAAHLFDGVCDLDPLVEQAIDIGGWLVEDAAQAIGAGYDGHHVGTIGGAGTLSFYASKTIAAGEGGMVLTNDKTTREQAILHRGQGASTKGVYQHEVVGFNYRMTELSAAIALAQLECFDEHRERRETILAYYRETLPECIAGIELQETAASSEGGRWICAVVLPPGAKRLDVRRFMFEEAGIETRPFFEPLPLTEAYRAEHGASPPIAAQLAGRGMMLPTHAGMTLGDAERVVAALEEALT